MLYIFLLLLISFKTIKSKKEDIYAVKVPVGDVVFMPSKCNRYLVTQNNLSRTIAEF